MSHQIIPAFSKKETLADKSLPCIDVAECFSKTIQGENFVGTPSIFLRVQWCTCLCTWCDSIEVWKTGQKYDIQELLSLFEQNGAIEDLKNGHHLILTGGSPLRQQESLYAFLAEIARNHNFWPFIEIENECVLMPDALFGAYSKIIWNNSPKLSNSKMRKEVRYKPDVIKATAELTNSWFKFVVSREEDWKEIEEDFLQPGLIKRSQIVLMPEGQTREELNQNREMAVECAIKQNVRYTERLHLVIWGKKTGV